MAVTGAERVAAAFAGGMADRPAICHISFSSQAASAILGREAYVGGGVQRWREVSALWEGEDAHAEFIERSYRDAIDVAAACDHDMVRMTYWRLPRKPAAKIDDYTFAFDDGEQVLHYDPATEQCSLESSRPAEELTPESLATKVAAMEASLDGYAPSEAAWAFELRAQKELGGEKALRVGGVAVGVPHDQVWLEAVALAPGMVRRYLDVQAEQACRNARFLAARGLKYLFGGFDFASQEGPMFSPAALRELLLPGLQKVSAECQALGVKHLFASDGRLWPVADMLFGESGVHGYYEIDRRAGMDLDRLRDEYPELTLIGNISSHTLHLGTPRQVADETADCMDTAVRRGGIIAGVSNAVVVGTPGQNIRAMLDTIRRYF